MQAYSTAQSQHRVLTGDVKFLDAEDRKRVFDKERRVVSVFANAIADVRPDLHSANLTKPLAMLLFGTLNWIDDSVLHGRAEHVFLSSSVLGPHAAERALPVGPEAASVITCTARRTQNFEWSRLLAPSLLVSVG